MIEGIDNTKLVKKLAEACDVVKGVEKKGQNREQNYKYQKAADVAMAMRHELFSRGIIVVQSENQPEFVQVGTTAKGSPVFECRIGIVYSIMGEGGQIDVVGYGVARDSGDKAIWKAKTGAVKYFLRGLGLIPDEKEDPEYDEDDKNQQWSGTERNEYVNKKLKELKRDEPATEADEIERWKTAIASCETAADFNAMIPKVKDKPNVIKMALMTEAVNKGFQFDRQAKEFASLYPPEPAEAPQTRFEQEMESEPAEPATPRPTKAAVDGAASPTTVAQSSAHPKTKPSSTTSTINEPDNLIRLEVHVTDADQRTTKAKKPYWLLQCQIDGAQDSLPVHVWDSKLFVAAQSKLGKDATIGCTRKETQDKTFYSLEKIYA